MGTYADERQVIANVLDGFTAGVPILWPDSEGEPPTPGSDPASPVSYLLAEVEYDNTEPSDFGGGGQIDGRVVVWVWVERNAGDLLCRQHIDSLRVLFDAGDDTAQAMYFLELAAGPAQVGGEGGEWYGRRVDIPFTRFR